MSNMLFFRGRGGCQDEAIVASLSKCAPILRRNPSLLIELLDLTHCGTHWESHIRLMALKSDGDQVGQSKKEESLKIPKDPYHFQLNVDVSAGVVGKIGRFDAAAYGANIPDIPLQDIELLGKSGWTEVEMRIHAESNVHVPLLGESDDPKLTYG